METCNFNKYQCLVKESLKLSVLWEGYNSARLMPHMLFNYLTFSIENHFLKSLRSLPLPTTEFPPASHLASARGEEPG